MTNGAEMFKAVKKLGECMELYGLREQFVNYLDPSDEAGDRHHGRINNPDATWNVEWLGFGEIKPDHIVRGSERKSATKNPRPAFLHSFDLKNVELSFDPPENKHEIVIFALVELSPDVWVMSECDIWDGVEDGMKVVAGWMTRETWEGWALNDWLSRELDSGGMEGLSNDDTACFFDQES